MSPPGKNMGETTCASVVSTSHRSPIRIAAPSSIASARGRTGRSARIPTRRAAQERVRDQARIDRPPAPCFSEMRSLTGRPSDRR